MLEKLEKGKVQFFREQTMGRNFGFIVPADGSREVYFNMSGFCLPYEEFPGELKLDTYLEEVPEKLMDKLYCKPIRGDDILYKLFVEGWRRKAYSWTYKKYWDAAQRLIDKRTTPTNHPVKVMENDPECFSQPKEIWSGNYLEFEKLAKEKTEWQKPGVYALYHRVVRWDRYPIPCLASG